MIIKTLFLFLYISIFNIFIIKSILAEETSINFEDGSTYKGEILEGKMEGKGTFVSAKNQNNQKIKTARHHQILLCTYVVEDLNLLLSF